ncbi:hypothetical protein EV401DRAFT_2077725 [Pisolithus croceorrhizus]|nr:hypothetical protein EV401DRAFT_2077725 [Pisolithus croceorrhizus]
MSDRAVVNLLLIQTYVYYMHYSEDTFAIKLLVAAIWIVDTLHVSFVCHVLYHYLVRSTCLLLVTVVLNYSRSQTTAFRQVWTILSGPYQYEYPVFYLALTECIALLGIGSDEFCRPRLKWLVTVPIMLFVLAQFGFGIGTAVLEYSNLSKYVTGILILVGRFVSHGSGVLEQITYYDVTPAWAIIAVAEVLITASLCVVFYSSSSGPIFSRWLQSTTKRLLNTLIIYAVNRCLLTSLVAIADLVVTNEVKNTWTIGLDFILGQLYANSFLASLNTREHLRSRAAGTPSDLRIGTIRFADPPESPRDVESSKNGTNQFDVHKVAVTDVSTANPALDKTTASRKEGEV